MNVFYMHKFNFSSYQNEITFPCKFSEKFKQQDLKHDRSLSMLIRLTIEIGFNGNISGYDIYLSTQFIS